MGRLVRLLTAGALLGAALLAPSGSPSARAAEPPAAPDPRGAEEWSVARQGESGLVLARTRWTGAAAQAQRLATVELRWLDDTARPVGAAQRIYQGPATRTSLAVGATSVLVALVQNGAQPSVRLLLAARGAAEARRIDAPRQGGPFTPWSVVACPEPGGYGVLWQELAGNLAGEARSYFGQLREDGTWLAAPKVVPVPWGFGAMAWNGHGYHLALYYDGAAYGQTRLAMVTLSPDGQPEQHPWWASPPEAVGEIQLLPVSSGMLAVWRGGRDETELRSTLISGVGQWGQEPAAPRSEGRIEPEALFALRSGPSGPAIVRAAWQP